jgi:hypothetical protein
VVLSHREPMEKSETALVAWGGTTLRPANTSVAAGAVAASTSPTEGYEPVLAGRNVVPVVRYQELCLEHTPFAK